MDINLELVEKQINYKPKQSNKDQENSLSIISELDFFCLNNIKICEKIRENHAFSNRYHIINDSRPIYIGEVDGKTIYYDMNITNKINKHVLLEYNKVEYLDFNIFLFELPNPKLFVFHVLDSYTFLLNSLLRLEQINVCFFNLSAENIFFLNNYKPILQNFDKSLLLDGELDIGYFLNIIDKIEDYAVKPIEIHVIFYLLKNNEDTLSFSAIDSICNNFVKNMNILSLFSPEYRENYYKESMNCLKKYINKPKLDIIKQICIHSNTWDNFGLSIIYLHIVGNMIKIFSLKETLMNDLASILSKNIGPDPLKRDILSISIEKMDKLFYKFTDWDYVNSLPKEKMKKLYKNLLL